MIFSSAALMFAVVSTSVPATSQAAQQLPISNCHVTTQRKDTFVLSCPSGLLGVVEGSEGVADAFTESAESAFSEAGSKAPTRDVISMTLDSTDRRVTRLKRDGRVLLSVRDQRGSRVRVLTCGTIDTAEQACEMLFAAAWSWRVEDGPPSSLPRSVEPLIAGRLLGVPEGCAVTAIPGGGSMTCKDASTLVWTSRAPDQKSVIQGWLEAHPVRRTDSCVVEGTDAECYQAVISQKYGVTETAAEVVVRGTKLFVKCTDGFLPDGIGTKACEETVQWRARPPR